MKMKLVILLVGWAVIAHAQSNKISNESKQQLLNSNNNYFRVSIKGFICNSETADDALERDGKRDEIYLTSQSHKTDAQGVVIYSTVVQHRSRVMGDINARNLAERRVMAGTADGGLGGIRTGDQIPDNEPFKNSALPTGDLLPFILWEGELNNGEKVFINPNIYEWDGPEDFFTSFWHNSVVGLLLKPGIGLASAPFRAIGIGENTTYNFESPGVWPAVGVAQQFPNLFYRTDFNTFSDDIKKNFIKNHSVRADRPADRPIGIEGGEANVYSPLLISLDLNTINRLINFDAGYGKGIMPIYYNDQEGLNGKYVVFISFEQVKNSAERNRINLTSADGFDSSTDYSFRNVNAPDKEADVLNGGTASNTHIVLNDLKGLNSQRWKIREANQYYFNISNNFNNGCLDILNKNNINGLNIVSSSCDASETQQWSFIRYCDGSWLVRNFKTKRVMEVYNAGKSVSSPLGQMDATNAKNQRWFIEKR